jgi:precorrin-2 dehydrogenase/sirohydrochlorin ferrochelatase
VQTLARRDLLRLDPGEVAPEALVALAQEGKQIVRLVVAPVDPAAIQALATASVAVEVLMAAPST